MVDNGSHDGVGRRDRTRVPNGARGDVGDEPRVRGRCEPRRRRHARAGRRGDERRRQRSVPGTAAAMLAPDRRRARPRGGGAGRSGTPTARSTRRPAPSRRRATRWVTRCSAWCARRTASPAGTASSTSIPTRPVTWSGSRAPPCGSGVRRSSRSEGGTSATSCTSRTSTSAGASAASAGVWPTSPAGTVDARAGGQHRPAPVPHDRAPPPVRVPVRHQELARRARASCCSPPRCSSSVRAGVAMAARALGARPGRPRVTG